MFQWRVRHAQAAALALALSAMALAAVAAWADGPIPPPRSADTGALMAPSAAAAEGSTSTTLVASQADRARPADDPFSLPAEYRCEDGAFSQEAIVAHQKRRLDAINEKLHTRLKLSETAHYLIFSDADAEVTARFVRWSEALYGSLCNEFNIDPKQRVWDGKCVLTVFAARAKFETFAKVFDEQDVHDAGAYFAHERFGAHEPNLVHMCIPADDKTPKRLEELFAHEGTHAFFQLYRKPVTLPLWLHEGLAEYMTVVNDPTLGTLKSGPARAAARQGVTLSSLFKHPVAKPLTHSEYSISYTLVDYLQKSGRDKFRQFVDLMKDGQGVDAALKTVYGFDTAGLQEKWRASLAGASPAPRPRAA
jgi:hypothetical protein